MTHKTKVFFNVNVQHRARIWETINNPPHGIEFIISTSAKTVRPPDYNLFKLYSKGFKSRLRKIVQFLKFPNVKVAKLSSSIHPNLIYSPGALLINSGPFVTEIDNVACLTYYNPNALKFTPTHNTLLNIIKGDNCKGLVCISEAARKSVSNIFNDKIVDSKLSVVYPYIKLNKTKIKHKGIRFLFVSTQFYIKGGKEVIESFNRLHEIYPNTELWMVTNLPPEIEKEHLNDPGIKFISANKTKEEMRTIYSSCDVYLHISYMDSFGLSVLEAIASGLPVIATDMFAIPEMVENGNNGFIIKSPVRYFNDDFTPNETMWLRDLNIYTQKKQFDDVTEFLLSKMKILIKNHILRKRMGMASYTLVSKGKFSIKERDRKLSSVLSKRFNTL